MNDTTELHQAEVSNLKQDLASMEEKIEYREEERLRELQDAQTRVSNIAFSSINEHYIVHCMVILINVFADLQI